MNVWKEKVPPGFPICFSPCRSTSLLFLPFLFLANAHPPVVHLVYIHPDIRRSAFFHHSAANQSHGAVCIQWKNLLNMCCVFCPFSDVLCAQPCVYLPAWTVLIAFHASLCWCCAFTKAFVFIVTGKRQWRHVQIWRDYSGEGEL